MAYNDFGWFGWFSAAGFAILGALSLLDLYVVELWPFSLMWTGIVALIAGFGALALYFGHDPTANDRERRETAT